MCQCTDPTMVRALQAQRFGSTSQDAETRAHLRQARADQPGPISQHGRRILLQVGHRLITVGRRLEQYGLPSSLALEEQMAGSRCPQA